MAKYIKKSELSFVDGYIVDKDNNAYRIDTMIASSLSNIDRALQEHEYLAGQVTVEGKAPSLDGFKPKTFIDFELPQDEKPETPVSDARVAEALAFMKESDEVADVEKFNELVAKNESLLRWIDNPRVFVDTCICDADRINTPVLGNPLELTVDDMIGVFRKLYETEKSVED